MEDDEEAEGAEANEPPVALALTTAKVQALAAAGRLVAFQVCHTAGLRVPKKTECWSSCIVATNETCNTRQVELFC